MGRGGEGLEFDPRSGAAIGSGGGCRDGATGLESSFEESSSEEGDASGMKAVDGNALGELLRLEELIRLSERRTLEG